MAQHLEKVRSLQRTIHELHQTLEEQKSSKAKQEQSLHDLEEQLRPQVALQHLNHHPCHTTPCTPPIRAFTYPHKHTRRQSGSTPCRSHYHDEAEPNHTTPHHTPTHPAPHLSNHSPAHLNGHMKHAGSTADARGGGRFAEHEGVSLRTHACTYTRVPARPARPLARPYARTSARLPA